MTVQEVFDIVILRLPGPALCSIMEAIREVQGIITGRLLLQRSDLLQEDQERDFAAGEKFTYLDDEFISFYSRPFVTGSRPLTPLGNIDTAGLQTPGVPRYYNLIGKRLSVLPVPDTAVVIQLPTFMRPAVLTRMTEELPFYGEFDAVFIDGAIGVLSRGLSVVSDRNFVTLIQGQVDQQLSAKGLTAEQLEADAINRL
jgi:hypothetical protein